MLGSGEMEIGQVGSVTWRDLICLTDKQGWALHKVWWRIRTRQVLDALSMWPPANLGISFAILRPESENLVLGPWDVELWPVSDGHRRLY